MPTCSNSNNFDNIISEAFVLVNEGKYDQAQLKALEAEGLLTENASLENRESLARLYGLIYFQQNIMEKAIDNMTQALKYAIEMNDTTLIIKNHFNLGLCSKINEDAISNFEQAAKLSQESGNVMQQSSSLEKLSQAYLLSNQLLKAQQVLDEAVRLCENNNIVRTEIAVTQCELWLAEGHYNAALQGYKSIDKDSLNLYGCLMRANAICKILIQKGDYKEALLYKDSIQIYTDSVRSLDRSKQAEEIDRTYHANIARKNFRFQIMMWSSILAFLAILIILFFVLKSLRLKKHQIELNDKISSLNAQIAELIHKPDENEDFVVADEGDIDSISCLIKQKYELSLEILKGLPQYESLRKLNLIREMNSDNKDEIKSLYDIIVGRFSGCCSDTRQAFACMTNDDCVFCTMNFVGCSKEVISYAMKSSEEALRRRKSRIKQKLPEEMFVFFFKK